MKTKNGFTLIELLITVAVISILTAVALPNYNAYVIRGKLAEGTSALSDGRVKMEQFFQDNRTYNSTTLAGNDCPTTLPLPATTTYFSYRCSDLSATTYKITATGVGSLLGWVYTIDQNNAKRTTLAPADWKTASMPGTPAACWITRKGGTC